MHEQQHRPAASPRTPVRASRRISAPPTRAPLRARTPSPESPPRASHEDTVAAATGTAEAGAVWLPETEPAAPPAWERQTTPPAAPAYIITPPIPEPPEAIPAPPAHVVTPQFAELPPAIPPAAPAYTATSPIPKPPAAIPQILEPAEPTPPATPTYIATPPVPEPPAIVPPILETNLAASPIAETSTAEPAHEQEVIEALLVAEADEPVNAFDAALIGLFGERTTRPEQQSYAEPTTPTHGVPPTAISTPDTTGIPADSHPFDSVPAPAYATPGAPHHEDADLTAYSATPAPPAIAHIPVPVPAAWQEPVEVVYHVPDPADNGPQAPNSSHTGLASSGSDSFAVVQHADLDPVEALELSARLARSGAIQNIADPSELFPDLPSARARHGQQTSGWDQLSEYSARRVADAQHSGGFQALALPANAPYPDWTQSRTNRALPGDQSGIARNTIILASGGIVLFGGLLTAVLLLR